MRRPTWEPPDGSGLRAQDSRVTIGCLDEHPCIGVCRLGARGNDGFSRKIHLHASAATRMTTGRAIVLARGVGTRMRAPDPSVHLTPEQQRAANTGVKPIIPLNGRPFLDFIFSSLADAGVLRIGLVVAPDHTALRRYYEIEPPPSRIRVDF